MDEISERLEEFKSWLVNKTTERENSLATNEPVLTEAIVKARMTAMNSLIRTLHKIKKPEPKPEPEKAVKEKEREIKTKRNDNAGNNPHDLIRCAQKEKYVWYATYDKEMQAKEFNKLLKSCTDRSGPIVCNRNNNRKSEEYKLTDTKSCLYNWRAGNSKP